MLLLGLDPNAKLAYAEDKWDAEATQDGIARLEAVVHMLFYNGCNHIANLHHTVWRILYSAPRYIARTYHLHHWSAFLCAGTLSCTTVTNLLIDLPSSENVQYGHSWMRATVQARKAQDRRTSNPREELG